MNRPAILVTLIACATFGATHAAQEPATVDFGRDVQPIFRQQCVGCHGAASHQAGFRLDRRSDAMRGSTLSPGVIRPGSSQASLLYMRIIGGEFGPQMPPTGALPAEQINTIKAWLDQGAEWPDALAGETPAPPVDAAAARVMDALRRGDRASFATLSAAPNIANLKGPEGSTPLMYAVLYGTARDVKRLLDAGADPNVRNNAGASALLWAVDDLEKTRMLVEKGADVNARSDDGRTPLMAALGTPGSLAVVTLLLDRGANASATATSALGQTTPIVEAAATGNEALMRLLIARGADAKANSFLTLVNALRTSCARCVELVLEKAPADQVTQAMLFTAPPFGATERIGAIAQLLERGADVNAKDSLGRTILMLVAASDRLPLDLVKTLIARGADVNAKSAGGETALSFAKQRGPTPMVEGLVKAGASDTQDAAVPAPAAAPAASPRESIARSLPLLQKTDVVFLRKSGCVSCHNNTLTAMSVAAARKSGVAVDEQVAKTQRTSIAAFVDTWRERALQGIGIPGDSDTVSYVLLGLAAEAHPADPATDAMAAYLRSQQKADGRWQILVHRPPIESNDIEVTTASMRSLQLYAPVARRAEYARAVARAAAWIARANPVVNEERAFHLLGLAWSGAPKAAINTAARALVATQRPDGGWSQLPTLASDAYATGQALYALSESGAIAARDPAFKKGVQFLLNTQLADGTWLVRSRAIAIQPLFDIGFPHGKDSWISAAATNWATLAMAVAAAKPPS